MLKSPLTSVLNDQYKVVLKVEERYSRLKSRPVARALQILELKKRPFYESMSIALSALHHNWGEIIFEVAFFLFKFMFSKKAL